MALFLNDIHVETNHLINHFLLRIDKALRIGLWFDISDLEDDAEGKQRWFENHLELKLDVSPQRSRYRFTNRFLTLSIFKKSYLVEKLTVFTYHSNRCYSPNDRSNSLDARHARLTCWLVLTDHRPALFNFWWIILQTKALD